MQLAPALVALLLPAAAAAECWSTSVDSELHGVADDGSFLVEESIFEEAAVRSSGDLTLHGPDAGVRLRVAFCTEESSGCLDGGLRARVAPDGEPALVALLQPVVAATKETEETSFQAELVKTIVQALRLTPARAVKGAKLVGCDGGTCVERHGERSGAAIPPGLNLDRRARKSFFEHPRSSWIFVQLLRLGPRVYSIAHCQDTTTKLYWAPLAKPPR